MELDSPYSFSRSHLKDITVKLTVHRCCNYQHKGEKRETLNLTLLVYFSLGNPILSFSPVGIRFL